MAGACEYGNELSGSLNGGISCLATKPVSFSRRTLLHGVSKKVKQTSDSIQVVELVEYSLLSNNCSINFVNQIEQATFKFHGF